ncbi:MAG: peptidylprolyl isomerase [Candidatus Marinimicrobia bacterium]|nr:peptidylprolyl isomerase [Candidatus Neomarinimicrobiota bacterium]MCF7827737.1 peptidylprolyl isomerase [Candidatus Neomarinimicrobiota bacterium]MCF7881463.1 peptidylprolyl isomerase [Candidatus Neomarinimicrobiota bacterium]
MQIGNDTFVTLDYNVQTADGEQVDSSDERGPLEFVVGEGKILPALEKELIGMEVGEEKTVTLKAEDAYGEYDDEAVTEVPRNKFPEDEEIKPGMEFVAQVPDQEERVVKVKNVSSDAVTIDFNHPLAGKKLKFNVFVQEVREAEEGDYSSGQENQ